MKEAVAGELAAAYHSSLVDEVRGNDFRRDSGRLTVHLAREFGFLATYRGWKLLR